MGILSSSSDSLIDDLLEEYWFFENLFKRRSRVLRYCHSDPYPCSSLNSPEKMVDSDPRKISAGRCLIGEYSTDRREVGFETKQLSEKIGVQQVGSFLQKKKHVVCPKSGSRCAPGKIQEAPTERCLMKAPSLPPRIGKIEVDCEAKKMIKKLTRQFYEKIRVLEHGERFLQKKKTMVREKGNSEKNRVGGSSSSVKISLQRTQTMPNSMRNEDNKFEDQETDSRMGFLIREALASSQNVPKVSGNQWQRPPRKLRSEETVIVKQGSSLRKTLSSIETTTKEIQKLKGCCNDQVVEPRVATGVTIPFRVHEDSRKEIKDQIKFWARAVATNVQQEC